MLLSISWLWKSPIVVRYLKGHLGWGIFLRVDSDLRLNAYCDFDWISCLMTRCSLTGYFVLSESSPISWKTKKQKTVFRSFAKIEYSLMATYSFESKWLKGLLQSLGMTYDEPMRLCCDSQATLHIAANPVFQKWTKHIEVDYHFIHDEIQRGHIVTSYVQTTNRLADIFTKILGRQQFEYLVGKLGIRDLHAPI